jgi:hypothetical protein
MGTSEQNYEALWAMRQENEKRLEELAAARHEREDDPLAEALRTPVEDPLTKWQREADEQEARFAKERAKRRRSAEPASVNWDRRIAEAIADERQHALAVIAETIAELADRQREAIDDAMRPLRVELAELKISNAELRLANAELRQQLAADHRATIDSPPLPLRAN